MSLEQETQATETGNAAPLGSAPASPRFQAGPSKGFGARRGGRYMGSREMRPRKVCKFCVEKDAKIDYKDTALLRGFISEHGKAWAGRITGACASHQRIVGTAIKRARIMALLPFASS